MEPELIIRMFRSQDLDQMLELEQRFPPSSRPILTRDRALSLSRANPRCCWVAQLGNRLVGFIIAELDSQGTCWIRYLQVDPELLGQSIPDKLIRKLIQELNPNSLKFG